MVERAKQTIKRRLGTLQLEDNPPANNSAPKMIIQDIRIAKKSVTRLSPFGLDFGRKLNSEWSLATDNFKSKLLLDEQNLERDLSTAEVRKETCDSRPRIKVARKGCQSRDVSPKFKQETTQMANTP